MPGYRAGTHTHTHSHQGSSWLLARIIGPESLVVQSQGTGCTHLPPQPPARGKGGGERRLADYVTHAGGVGEEGGAAPRLCAPLSLLPPFLPLSFPPFSLVPSSPPRPACSGKFLHSLSTKRSRPSPWLRSLLVRSLWLQGERMNILAPVRRDRVLAELPQCMRKEAALHSNRTFHPRVSGACQEQRTGTVGRFKISKVIVVGDLSVGKTCLINRFCKDTFDKNYKATIGVDFEMERFEVLGVPFSLQLSSVPHTHAASSLPAGTLPVRRGSNASLLLTTVEPKPSSLCST
ncbi:ras-related protein Rab-34 isoform X3 [Phascolarctos cinereus]